MSLQFVRIPKARSYQNNILGTVRFQLGDLASGVNYLQKVQNIQCSAPFPNVSESAVCIFEVQCDGDVRVEQSAVEM